MKRYEYIRLEFGINALKSLNGLAGEGWRVVSVFGESGERDREWRTHYALLERELPVDSQPSGVRK